MSETSYREAPAKRALPMLEDVRSASPCHARWDDMFGDEKVRFCGYCAKKLHDLSAMTRYEVDSFLLERVGARLYRRADGRILTADCPVGRARKGERRGSVATRIGIVAVPLLALLTNALSNSAVSVGPRADQDSVPIGATRVQVPSQAVYK